MSNRDRLVADELREIERALAKARKMRAEVTADLLRRGGRKIRSLAVSAGRGTMDFLRRPRTTYARTAQS